MWLRAPSARPMLLAEIASTMPMDCSQEGRDFAAERTATAPRASALSTIMAANLLLVSRCTASCATLVRTTSISRDFRTSPARATISGSRENNNECNAMVAGLYNVRGPAASYLSGSPRTSGYFLHAAQLVAALCAVAEACSHRGLHSTSSVFFYCKFFRFSTKTAPENRRIL